MKKIKRSAHRAVLRGINDAKGYVRMILVENDEVFSNNPKSPW